MTTAPLRTPLTAAVASVDPSYPPGRRPLGITVPGLAFVPVSESLWRVSSTNGDVLGHIERRVAASGERFAARLLIGGGTRSMPLGEFWSAHDAAECFH
ncbi:hypothetical protein MN032_11255 [Agromyces atrinae]|uniref:Uncharacterized protein n=1 Tax=Agromyces atrinae TaxID=592376 RepID=A0A4V1R2H6_9MICO|nr:hypothetical protein [Agromyces atrinae]MCI2958274.1 hypothetical protein [Agromyces atrinae]NYD66511.1 hypothetical protein [Agromyces atrinae]RXZ87186.1 hypothetical protein ESP50_04480 [Agromyces atrinae]